MFNAPIFYWEFIHSSIAVYNLVFLHQYLMVNAGHSSILTLLKETFLGVSKVHSVLTKIKVMEVNLWITVQISLQQYVPGDRPLRSEGWF